MKDKAFKISKEELNLIRFYGGIDSVIYRIEELIERTDRNRIGDWKQILDKDKNQLKLMKSLQKRMSKFFYPEDYENEDE